MSKDPNITETTLTETPVLRYPEEPDSLPPTSDPALRRTSEPASFVNKSLPTPRRRIRAFAAGAALTAIPVAGLYLYLRVEQASNARDAALETAADYDISQLEPVDPSLIHYHEVGRIDAGIPTARALSMDRSGNLLLAGNKMVRIIAPGGGRKDLTVSGPANAVFVADDAAIYVAVKDHVEIFAMDGVRKATWPAFGAASYLTGIAAEGDDVYVADSGRRVIVHTDRSGKIINEIGRADSSRGIPGLLLPSPHLGVAIAADKTIWVNNAGRYRMENYSPDGALERFWGTGGTAIAAFSGCCNPSSFSLMPDGSFITAEKGIARVKHYLADGRFDSVVAAPNSFASLGASVSVTIDPAGRVLILERGTSNIRIMAPNSGGAQ